MRIRKPWLILVSSLIFVFSAFADEETVAASNYTVSTKIELSETAINRFLMEQYNNNSIPQVVSGSIENIDYTLSLSLPQIILQQNMIKLHMGVNINSSLGSVDVELEPQVNVPSYNVNATQIISTLSNIEPLINNLNIDYRLKTALVAAYSSLQINIYPSKLVTQLNENLFPNQSIKLVNPIFGVQFNVLPGKLQLVLSAYLQAETPTVGVALITNSDNSCYIGFLPNIAVKVEQVVIAAGNTTYLDVSPNWLVSKRVGDCLYFPIGNLGLNPITVYAIKIRYRRGETWFSAQYNVEPWGPIHYPAIHIN